jgi:hypothetical protein
VEQASQVLDQHLSQEERDILPLAAAYLTAQEWDAIGAHAIAGIPKDRLSFFLGSMLEETTPEERAAMLGRLPTPARLLYRMVGQRRYDKEIAHLRAGVTVPEQRQP